MVIGGGEKMVVTGKEVAETWLLGKQAGGRKLWEDGGDSLTKISDR